VANRKSLGLRASTAPIVEQLETRRLMYAGQLDRSFDGDGFSQPAFTADTTLRDISVQADGKILVTGNVGAAEVGLARYNLDGWLDTTLGTGGAVHSPKGGRSALIK
jgi:hypothetical protein